MSSWYSNILTRTTSQISSLRSTLLSSDQDGDTDDDTHVCRVLRNYYTDKGRAFPTWLPPDPKSAVVPQPLYASSSVQQQFGARYGGLGPSTGGVGGGGGGPSTPGAGGLSSLWDSAPVQTQQQQTQSLRAGRLNRGGAGPGGLIIPGREDVQARPLPSQRAGSYQGVGMAGSPGGAGSAQDRLKQRLWGGRSATVSPSPLQSGSGGQFPPPPPAGGAAGTGNGSYEDRFMPGGAYGPSGDGGQRRPAGPRGYR
ncbi:hypothetical protein E4U13_004401 [Claviceps humidiphila]|uniref:Mso1 N-terminal domain-containing protein n=1 Tax=Claviceps humidiphila TaxID=1294629 RepID=A0A9P7PXF2_9HYPO|nr:hypothetical protein E4U13_004401 [Claviceps humidiphila]